MRLCPRTGTDSVRVCLLTCQFRKLDRVGMAVHLAHLPGVQRGLLLPLGTAGEVGACGNTAVPASDTGVDGIVAEHRAGDDRNGREPAERHQPGYTSAPTRPGRSRPAPPNGSRPPPPAHPRPRWSRPRRAPSPGGRPAPPANLLSSAGARTTTLTTPLRLSMIIWAEFVRKRRDRTPNHRSHGRKAAGGIPVSGAATISKVAGAGRMQ